MKDSFIEVLYLQKNTLLDMGHLSHQLSLARVIQIELTPMIVQCLNMVMMVRFQQPKRR